MNEEVVGAKWRTSMLFLSLNGGLSAVLGGG